MDELPARGRPHEADEKSFEEVVPARAVLTELARGFLLVQESNPDRARAFAKTFLKEREGPATEVRTEPLRRVTLARLALGRNPQGAIEPPSTRMPR
jgi:hypothetical protein